MHETWELLRSFMSKRLLAENLFILVEESLKIGTKFDFLLGSKKIGI